MSPPDPHPAPPESLAPEAPPEAPHAIPPPLHTNTSVREAAAALVAAVRGAGRAQRLSPADYHGAIEELGVLRGQPLAHPLLAGGAGCGARVQLADGRLVVDLVSGIGPYVFGHDDQDLLETAAIAAAADSAFQGHVLPGPEYTRLAQRLRAHAGDRLAHVWLALSGSMANENAWKIVLQKHAPASRVLAFEHAFHGRTLAMAELTDRPEYREGLPAQDFVDRIPFHDPSDPRSTQKSVDSIGRAIAAHPGEHAAMCFELVQGEGGFNAAPPAFFRALMECCHEHGLAVWVDEIQTFARMPELFAFRTLGLDTLVDVVTIGKILQGSATLFSADYCPRPKLVAGTWAGSTVGMALGERILERLEHEGYLGPDGGIARLSARIDRAFARLEARLPGVVRERSGLGAMQAFVAWEGEPEVTRAIVAESLEQGVLFQTAGTRPMKIRLLPPLNLDDEELDAGFAALERALRSVARRHGLAIE